MTVQTTERLAAARARLDAANTNAKAAYRAMGHARGSDYIASVNHWVAALDERNAACKAFHTEVDAVYGAEPF